MTFYTLGGENHPQMVLVYGTEVNSLPHSEALLIVRKDKRKQEARHNPHTMCYSCFKTTVIINRLECILIKSNAIVEKRPCTINHWLSISPTVNIILGFNRNHVSNNYILNQFCRYWYTFLRRSLNVCFTFHPANQVKTINNNQVVLPSTHSKPNSYRAEAQQNQETIRILSTV